MIEDAILRALENVPTVVAFMWLIWKFSKSSNEQVTNTQTTYKDITTSFIQSVTTLMGQNNATYTRVANSFEMLRQSEDASRQQQATLTQAVYTQQDIVDRSINQQSELLESQTDAILRQSSVLGEQTTAIQGHSENLSELKESVDGLGEKLDRIAELLERDNCAEQHEDIHRSLVELRKAIEQINERVVKVATQEVPKIESVDDEQEDMAA